MADRLRGGAHHRPGRDVPGAAGAGRIFANQVKLSGKVPQVCCLFGPSAAGGAYIPAFCDVVFMVDGNASMYLGSDRMVEMVTGEKTTLEAMGGARVHCATDWEPYAEQMLDVFSGHPLYENTQLDGGFAPRPAIRPRTRFEGQGLEKGHKVRDLLFRRV